MKTNVGTNDIEQSPIDSCSSQFQTLVDIASQKYLSSLIDLATEQFTKLLTDTRARSQSSMPQKETKEG